MKRQAGLTLAEVVLAMGLLSLILLTLVLALIQSYKSDAAMDSTEQAQLVAEEIFQRVSNDTRLGGTEHDTFWSAPDGQTWSPTWINGQTITRDGQDYQLTLSLQSVGNNSTGGQLGSGTDGTELADNRVKLVEIILDWQPAGPQSPGRGRESYSISHLVSERG